MVKISEAKLLDLKDKLIDFSIKKFGEVSSSALEIITAIQSNQSRMFTLECCYPEDIGKAIAKLGGRLEVHSIAGTGYAAGREGQVPITVSGGHRTTILNPAYVQEQGLEPGYIKHPNLGQ